MNQKEKIKIFKAVGNERRFQILSSLFKSKELSVGQISEIINLSFKSTSRHLIVLSNCDLVSSRQVSLNHFYSIHPNFPNEFKGFFFN